MNAAESDQLQITNILTYLMHHTDGHGDRETYLGHWTPDCVWESAIEVQGRKEAFFASALTKEEQGQLNYLLRKLVLALAARETARKEMSGWSKLRAIVITFVGFCMNAG